MSRIASDNLLVQFDAAGALNVQFSGRQAAVGSWTASDARAKWSLHPAPGNAIGPFVTSAVSVFGNLATIEQTYNGARAVHRVSVTGPNLTIRSRVWNLDDAQSILIPRFSGLTIQFARNPAGYIRDDFWTYEQTAGKALMHPCADTPLGAAFLSDGDFGVGIHTRTHLDKPKLIWAEGTNAAPAKCPIQADFDDPLNPGEAKDFQINFRFVLGSDWKDSLVSYREDFQAALGPIKYVPDDRPAAQFSAVDQAWVKSGNPFGFNSNNRRFDLPAGTRAFVDWVGLPLSRANGLGCLFWAIQGFNPRGAMYRPDFDIFPPEIAANLPMLVKGFKDFGLRVGLAARPGDIVDRFDWKTDQTIPLCADSPEQLASAWRRFSKMLARGFDMFYLDSFVRNSNDYRILKYLRAQAGPNVLFWSELGADVTMPLAGRYMEFYQGKFTWMPDLLIDVFRWLCPGASFLCVPRSAMSVQEMGRRRLTPLRQDYEINSLAADLAGMSQEFLKGKTWKP